MAGWVDGGMDGGVFVPWGWIEGLQGNPILPGLDISLLLSPSRRRVLSLVAGAGMYGEGSVRLANKHLHLRNKARTKTTWFPTLPPPIQPSPRLSLPAPVVTLSHSLALPEVATGPAVSPHGNTIAGHHLTVGKSRARGFKVSPEPSPGPRPLPAPGRLQLDYECDSARRRSARATGRDPPRPPRTAAQLVGGGDAGGSECSGGGFEHEGFCR